MCEILRFSGDYAFLHPDYLMDDHTSITHMYWVNMVSGKINKQILARIATPSAVTRAARFMPKVRGYAQKCYPQMAELTHWKFEQHDDLQGRLVQTHPMKLINGYTIHGDAYWGALILMNYPYWQGENKIGLILTHERDVWLD